MKITAIKSIFPFFFCLTFSALATFASSNSLTYQGRILKSDGRPLEYSAVSFIFQITDPAGLCVIYQEQVSGINMTNSGGVFDVAIGGGTVSWPAGGSFNIIDAFNNSMNFSCGACSGYSCSASSSSYVASASDGRKLRVQFYDGVGWQTISPDSVIRSVPFAGFAASAQKLGTYNPTDFIVKNEINNSGAGTASCDSGSFLTWDATTLKFGCAGVSGASGGTVTNVTATSPLQVVNGASTPSISMQAATASQSGYLTASDWTAFNNKVGSSTNFTGDVSGTYTTTSVDKLKGTAMAFSTLTSNDFLKYNGSNWVNSPIGIADITGLSSNLSSKVSASQFPASCGAGETLTRLSPAINFTCTPISISEANISGTIAGTKISGAIAGNAAGFTGSLTGDVTGTQGATKVEAIQNIAVAATLPTNNQVLQYNGTSWAPSTITIPTGTETNTANSLVRRDASGNFTASTITANLTGAASANVLKTGDTMTGNLTHAANTGNTYTAASGSNTVSIQGPVSAITSSYVLRLPTSQGTGALVNNGSGELTWQPLSSGTITAVTGTPKQVNATTASGAVSLSLPQDIDSTASPAFTGLTLSGLSAGIVKANAGGSLSSGPVAAATDISGILPIANGGTGQAAFANNSVIAMNNSGVMTSVASSTTGAYLRNTPTGPAWTTASFPNSTTQNQILYSSSNDVVTGLPTAANGFLATNASGVPSIRAIASTDLPTSVTSGLWTESGGNVSRNGRVGIGTSTPSVPLHILGPDGTTGSGQVLVNGGSRPIHLISALGTNAIYGSAIGFNATFTTTTAPGTMNIGSGTVQSGGAAIVADYNGNLGFHAHDVGTDTGGTRSVNITVTEKMRITSAGNVGIGTTDPSAKLEVAGVIHSTTGGVKFPDGTTQSSSSFGPAMCATMTTSASTVNSVYVKAPFNSVDFDTNSSFNTTTHRFLPPKAGYYRVSAFLSFNQTSVAPHTNTLSLYKNNALAKQVRGLINYSASYVDTLNLQHLIYMNGTTDYLEIWFTSNSTVPINSGGGAETGFCAEYVRP